MKVSLWIITDGKHEERVGKLIDSCSPHKVNVLCYGELNKLGYMHPEDFEYGKDKDTYFTANFNRILWKEMKEGFDATLIMNDDILWEEGALDKLLEIAETREANWGTLNPLQVDIEDRGIVTMGGTTTCYPSGLHLTYKRDMPLPDTISTWMWIPFGAPLVNLNAVRLIGMLDPNMKMWFSDSDWCMRAKWAQFNILLCHECAVSHKVHGTITTGDAHDVMVNDVSAFNYKHGGGLMNMYRAKEEIEEEDPMEMLNKLLEEKKC